ncbi:hypothetical protein [Flavobacterium silvaticum]|uniref:DUF3300 domain-containing protein n=1 Tax=Flavobacterium silvaticum TaxID=1852020 RepID=A0A972FJV8_9FLAO|nr:hypothetical protein [Flavobacterium silvaticum]NMH27316.1 hypothetical protein [Flavobacterium silvaticum]
MKTSIFTFALALILSSGQLFAQDRTTVTAKNYDISDNLDLRAVASLFGESRNLEEFEQKLNDPSLQISNLDLNGDNQVDYLRVIESTENNIHVVIIQSVLDKDVYQDVATVEVEKTGSDIQVQVVGDSYLYGPNYIYQPVYVTTPYIYSSFWVIGYRPYISSWYWGYYPSYYHYWAPIPVYRYHNHVHNHINIHNTYNYVNVRNVRNVAAITRPYRGNGWETRNPGRGFETRNAGMTNRHDLDRSRGNSRNTLSAPSGRNTTANVNGRNSQRNNSASVGNTRKSNLSTTVSRTKTPSATVKNTGARDNTSVRNQDLQPNRSVRNETKIPQSAPVRSTVSQPVSTPRENTRQSVPNQSTPRSYSAPTQQRSVSSPQRSAPAVQQPQRTQVSSPQRSAPVQQQSAAPQRQSGNEGGGRRR